MQNIDLISAITTLKSLKFYVQMNTNIHTNVQENIIVMDTLSKNHQNYG